MRKLTLFLTFLLLVCHSALLAQSPPVEWLKCYGGNYADFEPTIEPTSDGGYIMAGRVGGPGGDVVGYHGNIDLGDYWVVKMDHLGTIQWSRCLGGTFFDQPQMIHEAPDGSFLVLGEAASLPGDGDVTTTNHGGTDYWLVKLSATGSILWQKSYGGDRNEYAYDFKFTADGGYILAGETESSTGDVSGRHGGRDCWIVKVNSAGNIDWQRCIGGSNDDEAYSVVVLNDGYAFTGYTSSSDGNMSGYHGGVFDMLVAKLDLNGNLVWTRSLGSDNQDQGWGIVKGSDGGVVISGWTMGNNGDVSGSHGDTEFWLVKLNDQTGALVWQQCYGGSFNEMAYSIDVAPDGGYLLGGYAESKDGQVTCMTSSSHAAWIVKTSSTGALIWQKTLSGGLADEAFCVRSTSDGGLVASGYTGVSSFPGYHTDLDPNHTVGDLFVVKLAPSTATGPVTLSISSPPANTCSGSALTLTATATGAPADAIFKWFRNGTDANNPGSTYTATNFANGDNIYCQISVATGSSGCSIFPTAPASTTYTSNTVVLSVSPIAKPVISISPDAVQACFGSTVTFTASVTGGSSGPVYSWFVNGNPVGTAGPVYNSTGLADGSLVSCVYTDNTACVLTSTNSSNVVTPSIIPRVTPAVSIIASATTACAGSPVNFTATAANGGAAPAYQWLVNGAAAGADAPTYTNSGLANGDVVSCRLTSNAACSSPLIANSNTVTLTIHPSVSSSLTIDYDPVICSGQPAVFKALPANIVSPAYAWQVNGLSVGSGATLTTNTLVNGDVVSCQVTETQGCALPSTETITPAVYTTPVVGTAPPITLSKGQSVVLSLPVTGDIATYNWSPADGLSDATASNPLATPLKPVTYALKVTSTDGCVASGNIIVKVFSQLAIPGAFSPNGDGHNDVFYVIGGPIGSTVKDFAVFDRVGRCVFQVHGVAPDDPAFGWDGRVAGQPMAPGTYVYEIRMSFADKTQQVFKGTVVLVR